MTKIILKTIFTIILLGLFIRYFGWPAIEKYRQKVTFFSEEKWLFDKSKPPAISVYINNVGIGGWKKGANDPYEFATLKDFCNETANFTDITDCVDNKSYKRGELFQKIQNGKFGIKMDNIRSVLPKKIFTWKVLNVSNNNPFYFSSDNFIPNIYETSSGKIYTLNNSFILDDENCLTIWFLNESLQYFVYIHDPNFFISSINVAMPAMLFSHKGGETLMSKSSQLCEDFKVDIWF